MEELPTMRLSLRTFTVTTAGFGAVALYRTVMELSSGTEAQMTTVSDFGEAGIVLLAAACALFCALGIPSTVPLQKAPWVLVALSVLSFAVGDMIWAYQEVVQGIDPYPGIADAFYMLQYVLLGGALAVAGMRSGSSTDRAAAGTFSISIGVFALVLLWVLLLQPYVLDSELESWAELFLGLFYPIADVLLLFVPALFVTLVVSRVGTGHWAWAWGSVVVGVVLLAGSDSLFAWLDASGEYTPGGLVDYGWSLSSVMLAVGVSVARDLADPVPSALSYVRDDEPHELDRNEANGA